MNRIRLLLASVGLVATAGCASGYAQFYRPVDGLTAEAIASQRAAPPPAAPHLERTQPTPALLDAYGRRGYMMIGQSAFNSGQAPSESQAIAQARKVGADLVVVLDPRYTGTVTASIPLTTPTTTTSYTNSNATAYGAGGTVRAYGNATTTTYGTQTTYIPFTVNRADYGAVYFIKGKYRFGARYRELDDGERRALQSNRGVVLVVIVDNSPAYLADLLPGDIVTAVDGEPVNGIFGFQTQLNTKVGQTVRISIVRDGQRLEKSVAMAAQ